MKKTKQPWQPLTISRVGTFGNVMHGPVSGGGDGASGMMMA
jgi:hypothetical protein